MELSYVDLEKALRQGIEKVNELILENDDLKQTNLKLRRRIRELEDQIRPPVQAPKIGNQVKVRMTF